MTVEISVKGSLDHTRVAGDFTKIISDLNVAAAKGMQFVIATEELGNGLTSPVAFDTRNITRIRELQESDAFLRS